METTASKTESSTLNPLSPEPPVRILVQTLTHLVPGKDNYERTYSLLNRMCQHHWNCDFSVPKFRWASYNDQFAFNNRRCFFLVDYGTSQNDDDVPVLSYEWTGESLKPLPQLAKDPEIQARLKEDFHFTRKRSKRSKHDEIEYMTDHPEDMEWLKSHVRPRLWHKFVATVNARKPPGAPDIPE